MATYKDLVEAPRRMPVRVAERLVALRDDLGVDEARVRELAGLTGSREWAETALAMPAATFGRLRSLAEALGTTVDWLFTGRGPAQSVGDAELLARYGIVSGS